MPMGWTPNPGFKWNPLKRYPRNLECPCGSKSKFKKCCLPKIGEVVPEKDFAALDKFVRDVLDKHDKSRH